MIQNVWYRINLESVEQVEGDGSEQVEQEPPPHVVDGDLLGLVHDLAVLVHIRCPEVQNYICDWNE